MTSSPLPSTSNALPQRGHHVPGMHQHKSFALQDNSLLETLYSRLPGVIRKTPRTLRVPCTGLERHCHRDDSSLVADSIARFATKQRLEAKATSESSPREVTIWAGDEILRRRPETFPGRGASAPGRVAHGHLNRSSCRYTSACRQCDVTNRSVGFNTRVPLVDPGSSRRITSP